MAAGPREPIRVATSSRTAVGGSRNGAPCVEHEPQQWRFDWERTFTRSEWLDQLPWAADQPAFEVDAWLRSLAAARDEQRALLTRSTPVRGQRLGRPSGATCRCAGSWPRRTSTQRNTRATSCASPFIGTSSPKGLPELQLGGRAVRRDQTAQKYPLGQAVSSRTRPKPSVCVTQPHIGNLPS